MEAKYGHGAERREAQRVGASAAGTLHGLSSRKERALLLHLALHDPLTLPSRRYLLALRVSLRLMDKATWQALILALRAQGQDGLEQLREMLSEGLAELLEVKQTRIEAQQDAQWKPPPIRPIEARPAVLPGAPFHP